jgi:ribokinase
MLTILNPAPARSDILRPDWLRLVDVITPNEREAAMLAGLDAEASGAAATAAQRLRELGCGACIVTLGPRGALVVDAKGGTLLPARSVRAVDSTAAGDAFNGALAVGLAEGKPLVEAARWAIRAAALCVAKAGAQPSLPRRAEIEAFAADW